MDSYRFTEFVSRLHQPYELDSDQLRPTSSNVDTEITFTINQNKVIPNPASLRVVLMV